ncbi:MULTISPECIES: hypothetical protein [Massilia]|uniref:hypothetical protein n=1 Tax=Massilia TaxID=149698 RepID=UPI0016521FAC|nr:MULTISPECIES: hypothetical protein [Massilia]
MSSKHPQNPSEPCQHVTIADSTIGHVSICPECSVLHLSLNHVSVRFTPEAFRALSSMVGDAQARLDHVAQSNAAAAAAAVIDEARHGPKLH